MKTAKLTIEIEFNDSVDEKHLQEVAESVADALIDWANNSENGLAPVDGETYTNEVRVYNMNKGVRVINKTH